MKLKVKLKKAIRIKKHEAFSYIGDFLSLLYFKKDFLDKVNNIILFGSVARGDFDEGSDIDIFIDAKDLMEVKNMEETVESAINEFEIKAREIWHIRGIRNPIKCIVGMLNIDRWSELKKEMQSYGIILYGNFRSVPEGLTSYSLFEYSLKKLKQKKRVAIFRELLGYKSKKKNKIYGHAGLVNKLNGIKLENNHIIVRSKDARALQLFLIKKKITPKIIEIWLKKW